MRLKIFILNVLKIILEEMYTSRVPYKRIYSDKQIFSINVENTINVNEYIYLIYWKKSIFGKLRYAFRILDKIIKYWNHAEEKSHTKRLESKTEKGFEWKNLVQNTLNPFKRKSISVNRFKITAL